MWLQMARVCVVTLKPQREGHNTWFCCNLALPMALWPEEITIQESSRVLSLTFPGFRLFSFLFKCRGFLFRAAEQGSSGGVDWLESAGWKGWLAVVRWHSAQLPELEPRYPQRLIYLQHTGVCCRRKYSILQVVNNFFSFGSPCPVLSKQAWSSQFSCLDLSSAGI